MRSFTILTLLPVAFLSNSNAAVAQDHKMVGMTDDAIIKSAMSAAPSSVSKDAAIIAIEAGNKIRVVRPGKNNFTCMADNPATPGPDPMCLDQNALEWASAWINHKPPPEGKVGFMYMLAGGTDASNTDPYSEKPDAGANWIETGPHVMIVGATDVVSAYPRSPQPDTTSPYVMWPDTPYEHLMIPIK